MALRSLSQTGLIRVPRNPRQRNFAEGGTKIKRTALARINEQLAQAYDLTLHPTKGFRVFNAKSSAAAILTAEIKGGIAPFSMKLMRRSLMLAQISERAA